VKIVQTRARRVNAVRQKRNIPLAGKAGTNRRGDRIARSRHPPSWTVHLRWDRMLPPVPPS
jgi:hypothetical protein